MLNQNRPNPIFAGFFVRLSAFLIDTLIVSAALSIIKIPTFFISLAAPEAWDQNIRRLSSSNQQTTLSEKKKKKEGLRNYRLTIFSWVSVDGFNILLLEF